uniref:hypothetical protein n=1 Tax=Bradyrhizobium brasilense TaxID=1419277 RepID=UPI0035C7836F
MTACRTVNQRADRRAAKTKDKVFLPVTRDRRHGTSDVQIFDQATEIMIRQRPAEATDRRPRSELMDQSGARPPLS